MTTVAEILKQIDSTEEANFWRGVSALAHITHWKSAPAYVMLPNDSNKRYMCIKKLLGEDQNVVLASPPMACRTGRDPLVTSMNP